MDLDIELGCSILSYARFSVCFRQPLALGISGFRLHPNFEGQRMAARVVVLCG